VADRVPTSESPHPDVSVALWDEAGWLPCELSVELPVHGFSVRDLLELTAGSLVQTAWKNSEDAPLRVNGWQIGWVEFELIGESLGVRLTELL
jgi:flagellar motor switch/type III secretory pathway protein FliN